MPPCAYACSHRRDQRFSQLVSYVDESPRDRGHSPGNEPNDERGGATCVQRVVHRHSDIEHSTLRERALSWAGARYREIPRYRGRAHDIVPARYREPAHDINTRVRYRAAIALSCVCAILCAGRDIVGARDIAGPRCNIVRFLTISWPGRGIVPTRVILSATRDIVGRDRISPRAPTISRVCAISRACVRYYRAAHDIANTHDSATSHTISRARGHDIGALPRYRACTTILLTGLRNRGITRYRDPPVNIAQTDEW